MRGLRAIIELEVLAEHAEQMLFEPHDERVDETVEHHVCALKPHEGRVARREILHMDGGRNHRAADPQAFGDVPLHLRAQHQFGLRGDDGVLDLQMVVGDQRLDAIVLGSGAHITGELAAVGAKAADLEAQFVLRHAGGGDRMGGVAKDENPLARQIVGIDRPRVPGKALVRLGDHRFGIGAGDGGHFADEFARRVHAHRHCLDDRLPIGPLQPLRGGAGNFGIEHDVEIGIGQSRQIVRRCAHRRHHIDRNAQCTEQARDLGDIVAVAEAERRRAQNVAAFRRALGFGLGRAPSGKATHELEEGLRGAPVFLLLVGRQFQRDHRHAQIERLGEPARIVLDQFGGA